MTRMQMMHYLSDKSKTVRLTDEEWALEAVLSNQFSDLWIFPPLCKLIMGRKFKMKHYKKKVELYIDEETMQY